ncbi:cellulose binding domain-containing protein [Streptomyces alkaliphilus]|uniref:cellulose binding domain-containing protein n=1 Tax=Streptomyces alkaliphilus TaxID=1472722 RepID=UPI0015F8BF45
MHGTWPAGFNAQVWISNTGDEELRDRELSWTLPDGQHVTQMWSARPEQEGATVTVRPESRLSRIAPGSSVTFGFPGHRGDANGVPESFAIDGAACSVGRPAPVSRGTDVSRIPTCPRFGGLPPDRGHPFIRSVEQASTCRPSPLTRAGAVARLRNSPGVRDFPGRCAACDMNRFTIRPGEAPIEWAPRRPPQASEPPRLPPGKPR